MGIRRVFWGGKKREEEVYQQGEIVGWGLGGQIGGKGGCGGQNREGTGVWGQKDAEIRQRFEKGKILLLENLNPLTGLRELGLGHTRGGFSSCLPRECRIKFPPRTSTGIPKEGRRAQPEPCQPLILLPNRFGCSSWFPSPRIWKIWGVAAKEPERA